MGVIKINNTGRDIPVKDGITNVRIGTIRNRELFVAFGYNGAQTGVGLYTPNGWKHGEYDGYMKGENAYQSKFRYSRYSNSYAFKVLHRQSRIFSGENVVGSVQPGGYILTDGKSSSGSSHPYRLSITGYVPAGQSLSKVRWVTNGWCDTDIEIGKTMWNTTTIDGQWY